MMTCPCNILRSSIAIFVSFLILGAAVSTAAVAQDATPEAEMSGPRFSTAHVHWTADAPAWQNSKIEGANSTYYATENGISVTFDSAGLTPGHAVTLWIVIFNHPENCSNPMGDFMCGSADLIHAGGDPSVEGGLVGGGGHVIGPDGEFHAGTYLAVGDMSNISQGAPGLTNPLGAEVHLVIRDHGPVNPETLEDQLTTFGGECMSPPEGEGVEGDYSCVNLQFAVHQPGGSGEM